MIKEYRKKPIRAIQWDGKMETIREIVKFWEPDYPDEDIHLNEETFEYWNNLLSPGMYVVDDNKGIRMFMDKEQFESEYEEI